MIVFDRPGSAWHRGSQKRHAHLASTLLGRDGTEELLAFARAVGLSEEWVDELGEPTEHIDVYGSSNIARCSLAGAEQLSRPEFLRQTRRAKAKHAARGTDESPEQLVLLDPTRPPRAERTLKATDSGWVSTARVLEHLGGLDPKTLRSLMHDGTAAAIEPCWVNIGAGERKRFRWHLESVDRWMLEVGRWRASKSAGSRTSSGGETPTGSSAAGAPPTTTPGRSSGAKSKGPSLSERVGNLRTLARSRSSSSSTKKGK